MSADRWDANTRGLVAMIAARHAVTNSLGCNCGWVPDPDVPAAPDPDASAWLQWAAHNADAILAALDDDGLLVEPDSDDQTGDEIAQAIFDVLDDAMVPAGPDENGDDYGQWVSDLAPDLLAERVMAALTSHSTAAAPAGGADPSERVSSAAPLVDGVPPAPS